MSDPVVPAGSVGRRSQIYSLAMTAVMTAVISVLAPLSIPIGPIPVSLTVLTILLSVYILGWKLGTASVLVYLALGMVGVPVFSGLTGGLSKLLGPTGGYIIGYIPMALIAGLTVRHFSGRWLQALGMALGVAVLYAFGTAWYCIQAQVPVAQALAGCVWPFIPFDAMKILCVLLIGPTLRCRLVQAQLLEG